MEHRVEGLEQFFVGANVLHELLFIHHPINFINVIAREHMRGILFRKLTHVAIQDLISDFTCFELQQGAGILVVVTYFLQDFLEMLLAIGCTFGLFN